MRRTVAFLALAVVVLLSGLSGCATTGQYALTGGFIGSALGAGSGWLLAGEKGARVGAVVGGALGAYQGARIGAAEERSRALARGVMHCRTQERYPMGRVAVHNVECDSYTTRPGFRGDPLPTPPVVPEVRYEPQSVVIKPYERPPVLPQPVFPVPQLTPTPQLAPMPYYPRYRPY